MSSSGVTFPTLDPTPTVEVALMREAERRTMAVVPGSGFVVWSGRQRIGKTTTARWMVDRINRACREDTDNPNAFRAHHYEVGEIARSAASPQKQAIRSVYHAVYGSLDEGTYRQATPSSLARLMVAGLRKKRIRMIFIDEAGLLSLAAIRGMMLLRDTAQNEEWALSLVFIGMDGLPMKMERQKQIAGRIHEWITFEPYDFNDTYQLLATISDRFAALDTDVPEEREIVEWVHERFRGVPGEILPFYRRLKRRLEQLDVELSLAACTAVQDVTDGDRKRAVEGSRKQWSG